MVIRPHDFIRLGTYLIVIQVFLFRKVANEVLVLVSNIFHPAEILQPVLFVLG